jgi:stigma-specific protein Stig1
MRVCYDPTSPPMSSDGGLFDPSPGVGKCSYNSICNGANDKQCSTGCTDVFIDVNNCGSCGNACASGDSCCSGSCAMTCDGGAGTGGAGGAGSGTGGTGGA